MVGVGGVGFTVQWGCVLGMHLYPFWYGSLMNPLNLSSHSVSGVVSSFI